MIVAAGSAHVCGPNNVYYDMVEAAFGAGKPVGCERIVEYSRKRTVVRV
jgi:hypothetical protein